MMTDDAFELLKLIMLWSNGSICDGCKYKNDKDNCNVENCKKKIKEILDNKKDSDKT